MFKDFFIFFSYILILVLMCYDITKNYILKVKLMHITNLIKANIARNFIQNLKYNNKLPYFSYFNQKKLI